ncbi:MAG: ATP-binding protein, partial [Eggerthellaceae bacterium]|nr:ATP-binding protein [Eggerthellaceae bacterium]
ALSIIPEGSLVINEPNDGSAYAYGVDGLRTYYRYWRGYNSPNETEKPESALIRARICNIATDDEVRAAVELVGAEYVLQLEQGERSWQTSMWVYEDGRFWRGIDAVDNETEGFECILSRDDMRLYKIVL